MTPDQKEAFRRDLLPCPFCGSSSVALHENNRAGMWWVSCSECGLEAPSETGVDDVQAVAYWNRRAVVGAREGLLSEVDEVIAFFERYGDCWRDGLPPLMKRIKEALTALRHPAPLDAERVREDAFDELYEFASQNFDFAERDWLEKYAEAMLPADRAALRQKEGEA